MKHLIPRLISILSIILLSWAAASAEELTLELDPAATEIQFLLDATGHEVHGSFHLESGEIHFDPETGQASGEIRVDAAHSETGNAGRDKKMHERVLESALFPEFVFRAERFVGPFGTEGVSHVELHGQLELHGLSHPVALMADVEVDGDILHGKATFEIPFVKWGLHDPSVFVFRTAKKTGITVELVGKLRHAETTITDRLETTETPAEDGQDS